jgi:UDP-glucose 4-epimerase
MGRKNERQAGEPVLVTGGAGYIGSHVVRDLGENGFYPVVLDNLSTGHRKALLYGELVEGDIGDSAGVSTLIKRFSIRGVMHFAASIAVEESVRDPLSYYENNSLKSFALIRACLENGVERFIFSSTAAVYGIPEKVPVEETAPLRPINPYGASKVFTEMLLRDAGNAFPDFHYVSLRYFNVVGADRLGRIGQDYRKPTHLLTLALRAALGRIPRLQVFGTDYPTPDGSAIRDYIHVDDLSGAHLLALASLRQEKRNRVYNCGYGRGYSVFEVIAAVKRVTGTDFPVAETGRRAGDPPRLVADSTLIRRELGWNPQGNDLDEIIRSSWAWEQKRLTSAVD